MAAHINDEMLNKMDAYWRAANYLAAGQLYLLDNPLLKEPLKPEHIKKKIVGHSTACIAFSTRCSLPPARRSSRKPPQMRRVFLCSILLLLWL